MSDDAMLNAMLEADLQTAIVECAQLTGWSVQHNSDSRRSHAGWPDLVLVHPGRGLLFVELKRQREKPTKIQEHWLGLLARWHPSVFVWRPRELDAALLFLGGKDMTNEQHGLLDHSRWPARIN